MVEIDLLDLTQGVTAIFGASSVDGLRSALSECVKNNDLCKYVQFKALVGDLKIDWLQRVYQYYLADRKTKKQDFTPAGLASFVGALVGTPDVIIDLCAGSGALTIQKWADGFAGKFVLYEIDDSVIPFLLFNLAVRNIPASVFLQDTLQAETAKAWIVESGSEFATVKEVTP